MDALFVEISLPEMPVAVHRLGEQTKSVRLQAPEPLHPFARRQTDGLSLSWCHRSALL
jgi:hypothetical protein